MMMQILLIILGFSASVTFSKTQDVQMFCPSHNPQKYLEVKLLMGTWHIIEIVHHRPHKDLSQYQELTLNTCPTIQLLQDDHSNIRLVWTEETATLYYQIKRADPSSPGFWVASGPHKEDFAEYMGHHSQFTGTIEVMKAVGNHAVLTFCKSDHSDSQLFSVVIARDSWLPRADTRGVNRMLSSRGLVPVLMKRLCNGSTINVIASSLLLFISAVILIT